MLLQTALPCPSSRPMAARKKVVQVAGPPAGVMGNPVGLRTRGDSPDRIPHHPGRHEALFPSPVDRAEPGCNQDFQDLVGLKKRG